MNIFPQEEFWGNIEYKMGFIDINDVKIKKYATQLKFRIIEGKGEAVYIIGVYDNGQIIGISDYKINYHKKIMNSICNEVNCKLEKTIILECPGSEHINKKLIIFKIKSNFDMDEIPFLWG